MEAVRHEVEVDVRIAKKYEDYVLAVNVFRNELKTTAFIIGAYRDASLTECVDTLEARKDGMSAGAVARSERYIRSTEEARERVEAANAALIEADKEYEGWTRFFLVPGGHIHSTRSCSSCNKRGAITSFSWLPELSGLTEADAVTAHGSVLCTVCFPSAPVEWTTDKAPKSARKVGA